MKARGIAALEKTIEESGFWNYDEWGEPTRSASKAAAIVIDLDVVELVGLEVSGECGMSAISKFLLFVLWF